ncbi:MAG: hypothetical protein IKY45_01105 [Clostridia bacterium]|nr:hypothetical protein [Clostridia bacterium]
MKRIFCILLSLLIIFSFSSCGKDSNSKDDIADLSYFVKLGQIPECEYKIGDSAETINADLKKAAETSEDAVYDFIEGENNALIDGGLYSYYYKKANIQDGISYIVSYDTAFGFEIGTLWVEIENAYKDIKFKQEEMNDKNSFFLLGSPEGKVLKTEISDYTVSFLFVDNALCATAIYITNDWK